MKVLGIFNRKSKGTNFFELPSKEKKRIINNATRGANELQLGLAKEFDKRFISA